MMNTNNFNPPRCFFHCNTNKANFTIPTLFRQSLLEVFYIFLQYDTQFHLSYRINNHSVLAVQQKQYYIHQNEAERSLFGKLYQDSSFRKAST